MTTFVLKNINLEEINQKYGFFCSLQVQGQSNLMGTSMNIEEEEKVLEPTLLEPYMFSTRIVMEEHNKVSSFYNSSDHPSVCGTMVDYASKGVLPDRTDLFCFWCRSNIDQSPIGCPVRWINHMLEKNYKSSLTKDEYSMKENISERKLQLIRTVDNQNFHTDVGLMVEPKSYFQTDGIFCSFNCILAFIQENRHNCLYRESHSLLYHLYEQLIGNRVEEIQPAPHWRTLLIFGGSLSLEKFRSSFNRLKYTYQYTTESTLMRPMTTIYSLK